MPTCQLSQLTNRETRAHFNFGQYLQFAINFNFNQFFSNHKKKIRNFMNDSLRTDIFLRYKPENIVCACIYLSARELKIPLPQSPPWFLIFGADEDTIKEICVRIVHLYSHKTVKPLKILN